MSRKVNHKILNRESVEEHDRGFLYRLEYFRFVLTISIRNNVVKDIRKILTHNYIKEFK